jgi:hypothetical protein
VITVQENTKAVIRKMSKFEANTVKKTVRKGVRLGRKKTLAVAKDNAARLERTGTGMAENIADSLKLMVTPRRQLRAKDAYAIEVGFDTKKHPELIAVSPGGTRNFIPHAIEYGHAGPGQGGSKSKVAKPKPFMRKAHEATKDESLRVAKQYIAQDIRRQWSR